MRINNLVLLVVGVLESLIGTEGDGASSNTRTLALYLYFFLQQYTQNNELEPGETVQ